MTIHIYVDITDGDNEFSQTFALCNECAAKLPVKTKDLGETVGNCEGCFTHDISIICNGGEIVTTLENIHGLCSFQDIVDTIVERHEEIRKGDYFSVTYTFTGFVIQAQRNLTEGAKLLVINGNVVKN